MNTPSGTGEALQLALIIAHQLKSPITSLGTVLQLLLSGVGGPLTPRQREMLEKAFSRCTESVTSAQRLLSITRALERPETLRGSVNIGALLRQALVRYGERATEQQVTLHIELVTPVEWAQGDQNALTEVVDALFDNALKYTPQHGHIHLSAETTPEGRVRFTIADSGIGVPEDEREKIFEPFFRSAVARKAGYRGTGLGLAFVKALVEAAGGSITLAASASGGAAFTVELPALTAAEAAQFEDADANRFRIVIIGGVAAGPKVAAKIMRLMPDALVTVIERGRLLSYAGCGLPYYISGEVRTQEELMSSPLGGVRDPIFFQKVKNVRIMNQTEALEIDRENRCVHTRSTVDGRDAIVPYDALVLATGSVPVTPDVSGLQLRNIFSLHGVHEAEGIKAQLERTRAHDVVIVGGGLIGIEVTEALTRKGCRVTIIERSDQILNQLDWEMAKLVERYLEGRGVRIVTGVTLQAFEGTDRVQRVQTGQGAFSADMVIFDMGVRPKVDLAARAGLELGPTGAIKVDEMLHTSDPVIYAAGDCVESTHYVTGRPVYAPFGSNANRQGRVVAANIAGGREKYQGVLQSTVCRVFEYTIARTGLTEDEAQQQGMIVTSVLVPQPDAEHFAPGARSLMLKLVVEVPSRRLLGVQAIGPGRGDKRVDVAALAIYNYMTVDQLANMDLCYAPEFSPVLDCLITAANVARNKLNGDMKGISPIELQRRLQAGEHIMLLDVRAPMELDRGTLPGEKHIPLSILRERLGELPKDEAIVTFCSSSLRGYEAALILKAAGFRDVAVLDGGFDMWPFDRA